MKFQMFDTPKLPLVECSGCSACYDICPAKAIQMTMDSEGFLRPVVIYSRCIHCGFCLKTCPVLSEPPRSLSSSLGVYAAWNLDETVRRESSSGGVFSAIADWVISKGGTVFGAALDDQQTCIHRSFSTTHGVEKLRTSKYVQSDTRGVFSQVKRELQAKLVFFVGTPCQIAGLYSVLKTDSVHSNLITADLVCHGVNSPGVWKQSVKSIARRNRDSVEKVNFRSKKYGWENPTVEISWKLRGIRFYQVQSFPFFNGFSSNLYLRPSCYGCHFTRLQRVGDFTLGDFWGIGRRSEFPAFPHKTSKGISLLLVNSAVGQEVLAAIQSSVYLAPRSITEAVMGNPMLQKPARVPVERASFFADYGIISFREIEEKYLTWSAFQKLRARFKNFYAQRFGEEHLQWLLSGYKKLLDSYYGK